MISYFLTLSVCLMITFVVNVDSVCIQGQVLSKVTKYGTLDAQCVYNNIKVMPGSTFKVPAPDCVECKCTAKSLTCCGFGFAAGVAAAPPGCVAYNDACKLIFVKENNPSEICKTPKNGTANKKKGPSPRRP